jgi:AcrR family transcriptional regulator
MARTLNPVAHAVRRDAFLASARRLIEAGGYEQMSIQNVLDDVHASKGAFYHYFDSKAALLDAVVEHLVDDAIDRLSPIVGDPDRSALEKFEGFFGGIAQYKAEQRDLILGFMRAWVSDDNAIVREHSRRRLVPRLEPVMAAIVRQGVEEGVFAVTSADAAARVLIALILGMNEEATYLFLALDDGTISLDYLEAQFDAYLEAFERILAARPGALKFPDRSVLADWQRWSAERRHSLRKEDR